MCSALLSPWVVDERRSLNRYDAAGRVIATLPGNAELLRQRPGASAAEVDATWNQYATTYQYDGAGRKISTTGPEGTKSLSFYDTAGRLIYTIDAIGNVQHLTYNALNQLESKPPTDNA
jgi:YD repeat-containing protein